MLDSSFLLAVLFREQLNIHALGYLKGSTMSSVNFAEVWTKLHQINMLETHRIDAVFGLLHAIEIFTPEQARMTGLLQASTKHAGLSLGDRACLALALQSNAEAITTDRAWARIDVGCPIHVVR